MKIINKISLCIHLYKKMRKRDKIFLKIIVSEIILFIIGYFIKFYYSTPCSAPDFLHPFGKDATGQLCIQVIHQAPSPLFYLMPYMIALTLVLYLIYLGIKKIKKRK